MLRYPRRVTPTLIRRTVLVLTATALVLLAATPAGAETPEGWSDPAEVGILPVLLVIGVIPLTIALLIALAVYVPALARGESVKPGAETTDAWFGGPRTGPAELESRDAGRTGGGSGDW